MASLVPNLLIGAIPGLCREPSREGGIDGWLNIANLVPLDITAEENTVSLQFETSENLLPHLAFDFERFALAAAESFMRATQETVGPLNYAGWRLLEVYYAAFFASHAVMRSQGAGVAVLSKNTVRRIGSIASLYGNSVDLEAGSWFYQLKFPENERPFIQFRPVTRGSGVHDSFWREFCVFISASAARAVSDGLPDGAEFLAGAKELSDRIRTGDEGSSSWLAKVRNEINYRQGLSAWFPEPKKQVATSAITSVRLASSSSIRLDASKKRDPLASFASTCGFLTSVSCELSEYLAARSTKGGAFGQKWRKFKELSSLVIV